MSLYGPVPMAMRGVELRKYFCESLQASFRRPGHCAGAFLVKRPLLAVDGQDLDRAKVCMVFLCLGVGPG